MPETTSCECGKKMILRRAGYTSSRPAKIKQNWWCFACNASKPAPDRPGKSQNQLDLERWEEANPEEKP